jgi:hypothetical protein
VCGGQGAAPLQGLGHAEHRHGLLAYTLANVGALKDGLAKGEQLLLAAL